MLRISKIENFHRWAEVFLKRTEGKYQAETKFLKIAKKINVRNNMDEE